MKKMVFFLILIYVCPAYLLAQTTWTVGIGDIYDFSSLQQAHNGAEPNDVILLQQGGNYGGVTLTKSLIIKGPGYYLQENEIVNANQLSASLGSITFNVGSEGSFITGINTSIIVNNGSDNIVIDRCKITSNIVFNDVSNVLIRDCLISGRLSNNSGINTQIFFENCVFEFDSDCSSSSCYLFYLISSWSNCTFNHNIFIDPSGSSIGQININYCISALVN